MQTTPQYIVLIVMILELVITIKYHKKPKEGNYSFWKTLILVFINLSLLYWGGFFDKMLNQL